MGTKCPGESMCCEGLRLSTRATDISSPTLALFPATRKSHIWFATRVSSLRKANQQTSSHLSSQHIHLHQARLLIRFRRQSHVHLQHLPLPDALLNLVEKVEAVKAMINHLAVVLGHLHLHPHALDKDLPRQPRHLVQRHYHGVYLLLPCECCTVL